MGCLFPCASTTTGDAMKSTAAERQRANMIDIKFTINGLETAKRLISICPGTGSRKCRAMDACDNAITLLKEQEAKTGTWQWKIHGKAESGGTLGEAICDKCGKSTYATAVKGDLNYCPNCGAKMRRLKAVKQDEYAD